MSEERPANAALNAAMFSIVPPIEQSLKTLYADTNSDSPLRGDDGVTLAPI